MSALLSGFDTVARRATQTEVAAQKARQDINAAQQIAVQKKEMRLVELAPVQIVGRRLSPEVQVAGTSRAGLLPNAPPEQKPLPPTWASMQRQR